MLRRVCLITNYNLYESKRHFTQKLSEALSRKQIQTKVIDVREETLTSQLVSEITQFNPDLTCSFNTLLPIAENKFLCDFLETPHLSILVDPALYAVNLTNSPYSIISSVDHFDCDALRSNNFKNVFFWAHAVEQELNFSVDESRPYDVVFLGSCYDYESLRKTWQGTLTIAQCKVLDDAIDLVLSSPEICLSEALVKAWTASKLPLEGVDFIALFFYLDYYTRGKDRVDLIRSIKDAKVHVFGENSQDIPGASLGWSEYLASRPNVTLHPSVSFPETFNILKRSKICLNSMPFFKNGSHERIFTALACGALPLTSDNLFVRDQFVIDEELLTYQSRALGSVNDQVNHYLADEKKRANAALNGRKNVMENHTWDVRVDQLMQNGQPILKNIITRNHG